jgi:hypothetical protein
MPQFVLNWYAAPVMVNPNSIGQRAVYRQKAVGGSFISTGFTPANDLTIVAQTITSPNLSANKIWEFKIQALCTQGGPVDNNNGIQEALKFACITPTLSSTISTATIQLNISGLDITKAVFSLHLVSDNTIVYGPVTATPSGSIIQTQATGIDDDTDYYWTYALKSTVGGVEISSTDSNQLNQECQSINFHTPPDVCLPVTATTAVAAEF